MLRDMEELLNSVYDEEIKEYLREALKCYMGGSYRACVIMSLIAGVNDLHKKVKALAGSDQKFKDLDDEIERKRRDLEVYEKFLFEQCATEEIDMINYSELKELQRCLDTRNDCAHPSNFICSPEKARDIYSSIIDILASKPVLFGCKHMKIIISEMKEKTFFPVVENTKMKSIICEKLGKLQKKAVPPLMKLICTTIKTPDSLIQKTNALRFLSLSVDFISDGFEDYISEFINKDQYEGELLAILDIDVSILNIFSEANIEKIICKLDINLNASEINNINTWTEIILSDRLQETKHINKIAEMITAFKSHNFFTTTNFKRDDRYNFVKMILENGKCSVNFRNLIRQGCYKEFSLDHYFEPYLIEILKILNWGPLYELWLKTITRNISGYNFNTGNKAVTILKSIKKEYWINSVTDQLKLSLVKAILYEGTKGGYYSHDCEEIMYRLDTDYQELIKLFLANIFCDLDSDELKLYLSERYSYIISKYIVSSDNDVEMFLEKIQELNNKSVDTESIISKLIMEIERTIDSPKKEELLSKIKIGNDTQ